MFSSKGLGIIGNIILNARGYFSESKLLSMSVDRSVGNAMLLCLRYMYTVKFILKQFYFQKNV